MGEVFLPDGEFNSKEGTRKTGKARKRKGGNKGIMRRITPPSGIPYKGRRDAPAARCSRPAEEKNEDCLRFPPALFVVSSLFPSTSSSSSVLFL